MSTPTASWPLIVEEEIASPSTVPPSAPAATPATARRFFPLGNGVIRPFQRDRKGDFAHADGARLVSSAMGQVLGTRASSDFSQGELPWRPEFGSLLYLLKHRPNNASLDELAYTYVVQAIQRWEPRVRVSATELASTPSRPNTYTIKVKYALVDTATGAVIQDGLETSIIL